MDKKGLSAIVTSLIIVLLVFVLISILWMAITKITGKGAKDIELNQKCLDINIQATSLVNLSDSSYKVTFKRTSTGKDIAGIKLVFFNSNDETSEVIDLSENISPLATLIRTIDAGITDVNKLQLTPYFLDESENEVLCPLTNSYEF